MIEAWSHVGKIVVLCVCVGALLTIWGTWRAYLAPGWAKVPSVLWQGLEDRRWRERHLPFWVTELAELYLPPRPSNDFIDDADRLEWLTWARGADASREIVFSAALTRRSVERLKAWVDQPQLGVEGLMRGWWYQVARERTQILRVGVARTAVPLLSRIVRRSADLSMWLTLAGFVMAALLVLVMDPGPAWFGWVMTGSSAGILLGFLGAVVGEARNMPRSAKAKDEPRWKSWLLGVVVAGMAASTYALPYWGPALGSRMSALSSKVDWETHAGQVVLGGVVLISFTLAVLRHGRVVLDNRQTLRDRSNSVLAVAALVGVLVAGGVTLAPAPLMPLGEDTRSRIVIAVFVVWTVLACLHAVLEHVLFRRRLAVVRAAGAKVRSGYRPGTLMSSILCFLGVSILLSWVSFVRVLPLWAEIWLTISLAASLVWVVWQSIVRWRWCRQVDRAFSAASAAEAVDRRHREAAPSGS